MKTPVITEEDLEPTDEISQWNYSSDQLYNPSVGAVTNDYL